MRDDELRTSNYVEDRRGMGGVARGGLGVGAIVVLSPDRLGHWNRPKSADRRSGNGLGR